MNTENNKEPLYKRLREKIITDHIRVGTIIEVENGYTSELSTSGPVWVPHCLGDIWGRSKEFSVAQAEYLALAHNNLHILAEALHNLYSATSSIESSQYFADELRAAKEALKAIS